MTGQNISHYRILEKLGEGGMGVVYKAEDVTLRRIVALKFLPAHSSEGVTRLLREAQAAASLNHPNICTIHEINEEHRFIAMEFIEGSSVREKIATRPLPVTEALDISLQTCAGLQAAHAKAIVHRDMKPANLMLTAHGQVKIMDFGLAQIGDRTRITKSGVSAGTPAYMSPEQAHGHPTDHRTDIWSLGVVLYEMVTGRLPFPGDTEHAVSFNIVHSTPEPLTALRSGLPLELDRIVSKTLAKDTAERYQHVDDLSADLRRLARLQESVPAVRGPGGSRRRWLVVTAGIALGMLLAAVAFWRLGGDDAAWNPLANARYTRLTDFEGSEQDAAISPDGKLLAFLSDRDGPFDAFLMQIDGGSVVNLSKGQFPRLLNEELRNLGFSADSASVWLRTHDRMPGSGGAPARVALTPILGGDAFRPFLDGCVTAAWSADGSQIVYHDAVPGDPTYIVNRTGGDRRRIFILDSGRHAHYPTWSPDARHIYFSSGFPPDEMDVWRIPSAGGTAERMTSHNSRVGYPTLLDDRTLLYTATAEDGSGLSLYAMDLERRVSKRVSSGVEQYISISADAAYGSRTRKLVATISNPSGALASVPIGESVVEESSVRKVTAATAKATSPRWGPDYLLHLAARGTSDSLWLWKDGKGSELWRGADGGLTAPASPSPGGKLICFSYRLRNNAHLYLMNADGTGVRRLTDAFQVRSAASWSPDGKWVVVAGDEGSGGRIFKVPIDGGAPVRLVNVLSFNPAWSPDNRLILYSEGRVATDHTVKAITPEGQSVPIPDLQAPVSTDGYRFLPGGKQAVVLQGYFRDRNFWLLDFSTGKLTQLTKLVSQRSSIRRFDISPDGKTIYFDRITDNSDIVLIEAGEVSAFQDGV